MSFFVKHPPGDGLPPRDRRERDLFTLGETLDQQTIIQAIERCEGRFDYTGNPIEAINAFTYATRAGLYPPLWALEFICERFLKASKGGWLLDRAFGFTGQRKGGRTPPAKQERMDIRDRIWCLNFFKLEAAGLTPSAAGKAIAAMWQKLTGETVTGAAVRKAVKALELRLAPERAHTLEAGKRWTMEGKRELLRAFGAVNLPRNIRKLYGI